MLLRRLKCFKRGDIILEYEDGPKPPKRGTNELNQNKILFS